MTKHNAEFHDGIIVCVPHMRAFARALTGSRERADDLVQDSIVHALAAQHQFQRGTNLRSWLLTILRNHCVSQLRRQRIEAAHLQGLRGTSSAHTPAAQHARLEYNEVAETLTLIPEQQREALILVTGAGMTYDEAASICGCAIGTVKSRVNRARNELRRLLETPRREQVARFPLHSPINGAAIGACR